MDLISLKAWYLSAIIYDIENLHKNVEAIRARIGADFNFHVSTLHQESQVFGLFVEEERNTAYVVSRGTGGGNLFGKIRSWRNNLNLFAGPDGVHNGFQELGDVVFDELKDQLSDYPRVVICGHSQGGGVSQRVAQLCCRHLSRDKLLRLETFGSPPCFKGAAATEMIGRIDDGRLLVNMWLMPGDPLGNDLLRDSGNPFLNGVNIAEPKILPDLITYRIGLADVVNHSPRMYSAGILAHLAMIGTTRPEMYLIAGLAFDRCIN